MDTPFQVPSAEADGPRPGLAVFPLPGRRGVRAAGEVGLTTRAIWEGVLEQAVREGEDVYHLELSDVTFVDVAGAGALAAAAGQLRDGRRFVVRRPPAALRRTLDLLWPDQEGIEVSAS
ncbi:STAS domain-containing protein [Streptomyces dubilierae]|uniref:STAS domain-containing protein n=1 Tax=Streptomyces dubilierae TaxID=3075533 RepID=A0ABU2PHK8_9ACTN|nr:STAS domain-containing protein [Streptomyces sp. DSM 41921]MDT0390524.1 STAS domain-containing protein [Streptomyces sp. DSM 41921]